MMTGRSSGRWLQCLALGGILVGHCLAHMLGSSRSHPDYPAILCVDGRFPGLLAVSVIAAFTIGGFVAWVADRRHNDPPPLYLPTAGRLTVLQVAGFLALQIGERTLFTPAPLATVLSHLLTEPAILLGLWLQIIVGALAALLLIIAVRAVHRWFARATPAIRRPAVAARRPPPVLSVSRQRADVDGRAPRAPPQPLLASI